MAREFKQVVGIDLSQTFIDMANKMKESRRVEYSLKVEGDITQPAVATIDAAINSSCCTFLQVGVAQGLAQYLWLLRGVGKMQRAALNCRTMIQPVAAHYPAHTTAALAASRCCRQCWIPV